MASFPISNPPADLTMVDVMGFASAYGGFAKSCRYVVRVLPQGDYLLKSGYSDFMRQLSYLTEVAYMPDRSFMNMDNRYYGPNFKIPYQSVYEDITMTFLCRTQSFERQFFDDWMEIINPTNLWDFNYVDQYVAEINVYQLADYGDSPEATAPAAMYQWSLHRAYPIAIQAQEVNWGNGDFQRLTVSFTYSHWTRRGWDRTPGNFAGDDGSGFIKGSQVANLPLLKTY